jgi:protein SCO1/2
MSSHAARTSSARLHAPAPMKMARRRTALILAATFVLVASLGWLLGDRLDPTRRLASTHVGRPLPFAIARFALTDQSGHAVDDTALRGKIWVADFVFLQCGDTCARLTRRLLALQRDSARRPWANSVRFVSFSVDPDDGPTTLARYRRSWQQRPDARWQLLAADRTFPRLAVAMGLADSASDVPASLVVNSRFLFLVDRDGMVRGRYDGFSDRDVQRLGRDLALLASEPPP